MKSSRLIIKNIPTIATQKQIQEKFSKFGDVTDIKLLTKDDKKRRFCFVGFKSVDIAEKTLNYFQNTYMNLSKITLDYAQPVGSTLLKKNQKKQKVKKNKPQDQQSKESNKQEEQKKLKFQEYLQLMKQGKQKIYSLNDNLITPENENKKNSKAKKKSNQKEEKEQQKQKKQKEEPQKKIKKNDPPLISSAKTEETKSSELPVDERRLFIVNLPYNCSDQEVKNFFIKYGNIVDLKIAVNKKTGQSKGYAHITFEKAEEALKAFIEQDQQFFMGRRIFIRPGYEDKNKKENESEEKKTVLQQNENTSFKKEKKKKLLNQLDDETNWNTLFLNPNSIMDAISEKLQIPKKQLLEQTEDLAVKVSLAETQIVNETKDWLISQGFNLDFLNEDRSSCERSSTILFIKNISYKLKLNKLQDLFSNYGEIDKMLIAPNKSIAVVEFSNEQFAKNAYQSLSYYKINNQPLYLEWAPISLIAKRKAQNKNPKEIENKEMDEEIEEENLNKNIVYIKNLNFSTTEEKLKEIFKSNNFDKEIKSIKIITTEVNQEILSKGYGFIEFDSNQNAIRFIKALQHIIIDNHSLQFSISRKKQSQQPNQAKKKKQSLNINQGKVSCKIIIRNLAFQATKQELKELVKNFGEVKTIRLPKKMNQQHRGFAFIEFMSEEEAMNAYNALQHTHLYGRRLNIEWAEQDKSLDNFIKNSEKQ